MLYWILQTIILSIVFIVLVHNLIILLKTNLTVPKVKDLVNSNSQKYERIYNTLNKNIEPNSNPNIHQNQNNNPTLNLNDNSISNEYNIRDLLPNNDTNMKNELKNFLKSQLNINEYNNHNEYNNYNNANEYNRDTSGTEIAALDSNTQIDYSDF